MKATTQSSAEEEADATQAFLSFQKEVAVMCKLQHPNLLRLYGVMLRPLRMVLGKRTRPRTQRSQCSNERGDMITEPPPTYARSHTRMHARMRARTHAHLCSLVHAHERNKQQKASYIHLAHMHARY